MNPAKIFIDRPVATTLLTLGILFSGVLAFFLLPVAPLPQVDFPTIFVQAQLPGASPETVATALTTPLERHLGQIADVTEMTSESAEGSARIVLQFGLSRNIDGAARDVQAAINAARSDLPAGLRANPTYRKVNPADAPVMILALTSKTMTPGQMYDSASTVLEQKISQIKGIGEVIVGGASLPAVRVELNPYALAQYGIGLENVRAALAAANAHAPKGALSQNGKIYQIYTNDQARGAAQYRNLPIAWRNGATVRLSDVAQVDNSVENLRNEGLANGHPAILIIIFRAPGANIISTIDRVKAELPVLKASIPAAIDISVPMDRSASIRTSLHDVEMTLLLAVALVIGVVYLFLHSARATLIPSAAVPVSLIGTFGAMYLLGYSLDNLSLMALIVGTGFVVDDAIVVLENISRHIEDGVPQRDAVLQGAREVSFTVLSMSLSLVAVFIPILMMGGIVGRLFREFAAVLSVAILISLCVSLSTTPMMCAWILKAKKKEKMSLINSASSAVIKKMHDFYAHTLKIALTYRRLTLVLLLAVIGLNFYLFIIIPKGFFPQQDIGRIMGAIRGDQSISFQLMRKKMEQFVSIIRHDPAVASVVGFTGGDSTNTGRVFIALKPQSERPPVDQVIARLRKKMRKISGATLFLQPVQDIRAGGRMGNAEYQYTLQSDSLADLRHWAPVVDKALKKLPELRQVNSDEQAGGLMSNLVIDRSLAARFGLTMSQIDNTLYDAFGQRQVSTIYNPLNQYHVVMEVAPQYWQNPDTLKDIYVSRTGGALTGAEATSAVVSAAARNAAINALAATVHGAAPTSAAVSTTPEPAVPLAAFSHLETGHTPLSINHQGLFAATTISFNLAPGEALGNATAAINRAVETLHLPINVHGSFQGTAKTYKESLAGEPVLIGAAVLAIYIVLGILYESYVHPVTILSTLPSAGVGALLALLLFHVPFSIMALIGVLLLIGIVKKNAIMMIDVAIDSERQGMTPDEAIFHACLLRFRPIMMTTLVALLSALPLAFGIGEGAEIRVPLGISIVGGLIFSQLLTLYTTPVVYLYLERLRRWFNIKLGRSPDLALPGLQGETS